MPPKQKNTREEIAAAAFAIIKQEGLSALTARRLEKNANGTYHGWKLNELPFGPNAIKRL